MPLQFHWVIKSKRNIDETVGGAVSGCRGPRKPADEMGAHGVSAGLFLFFILQMAFLMWS